MFRRFTDHPATVNETYFQHMAVAFGFGGRMLLGALACFVHGLFPWLCLTRGSDTVRAPASPHGDASRRPQPARPNGPHDAAAAGD